MDKAYCEKITHWEGKEYIHRFISNVIKESEVVYDCNKCKHKLACLLDPINSRLYKEIET